MTIDEGRGAFARQAWADAYPRLSAADRETRLEPEDLERLATVAYLVGRHAESADGWARAHQEFLSRGDAGRAARSAFWLALGLLKALNRRSVELLVRLSLPVSRSCSPWRSPHHVSAR